MEHKPMRCGGTSDAKPATPEIQALCDTVQAAAEEKAGKKFEKFVATSYATQVVAGTNYFIKVDVGQSEYLHLRVYKSLPHAGSEVKLHSIQTSKTHDDKLAHF